MLNANLSFYEVEILILDKIGPMISLENETSLMDHSSY